MIVGYRYKYFHKVEVEYEVNNIYFLHDIDVKSMWVYKCRFK